MPKRTSASPIRAASDSGEVNKWWLAVQIDVFEPKVPCARAVLPPNSTVAARARTAPRLGDTEHARQNPPPRSRDQPATGPQNLQPARHRLEQAPMPARCSKLVEITKPAA